MEQFDGIFTFNFCLKETVSFTSYIVWYDFFIVAMFGTLGVGWM